MTLHTYPIVYHSTIANLFTTLQRLAPGDNRSSRVGCTLVPLFLQCLALFLLQTSQMAESKSGMVRQSVEYSVDGKAFEGVLYYDQQAAAGGRKLPAVVVCHAWAGRSDFDCQAADRLAQLGYAGFALDVYGKGVLGSGPEENQRLMKPLVEDRNGLLLSRLRGALGAVKGLAVVDPANVAAIGYCFGGLCVLDLARAGADLRGVVSLHGLLSAPPGSSVGQGHVKAKVLVLHGHDDPMVPPEQVLAFETEMTCAGVDWQVHAYGGTKHSFTHPGADAYGIAGVGYSADADRRSWVATRNFLEEVFAPNH